LSHGKFVLNLPCYSNNASGDGRISDSSSSIAAAGTVTVAIAVVVVVVVGGGGGGGGQGGLVGGMAKKIHEKPLVPYISVYALFLFAGCGMLLEVSYFCSPICRTNYQNIQVR